MKVDLRIEPDGKEPYAIISVPKLTASVQAALALLEKSSSAPELLVAKRNGRIFVLEPSEVELVRTEGGSLRLFSQAGESYDIDGPLHKVQEQLGKNFVRIGKGSLVNIRKIDHVSPLFNGTMSMVTKSGVEDYISRKYLRDFKERLGL